MNIKDDFKKINQIFGLIVFVGIAAMFLSVLVIGLFPKKSSKAPSVPIETGVKMDKEEVYSLAAEVLSVDIGNNFLIVKPANAEKRIKVILNKNTKLIKLEFPSDVSNLPPGTVFNPKRNKAEISQLKEGDKVFIKTFKNIANKDEFGDVEFIEILS